MSHSLFSFEFLFMIVSYAVFSETRKPGEKQSKDFTADFSNHLRDSPSIDTETNKKLPAPPPGNKKEKESYNYLEGSETTYNRHNSSEVDFIGDYQPAKLQAAASVYSGRLQSSHPKSRVDNDISNIIDSEDEFADTEAESSHKKSYLNDKFKEKDRRKSKHHHGRALWKSGLF